MNQLVTLSYEETLKAEARARRLRLIGPSKSVNIMLVKKEPQIRIEENKKPVYLLPTENMLKNEPKQHVEAFKAYSIIRADPIPHTSISSYAMFSSRHYSGDVQVL